MGCGKASATLMRLIWVMVVVVNSNGAAVVEGNGVAVVADKPKCVS